MLGGQYGTASSATERRAPAPWSPNGLGAMRLRVGTGGCQLVPWSEGADLVALVRSPHCPVSRRCLCGWATGGGPDRRFASCRSGGSPLGLVAPSHLRRCVVRVTDPVWIEFSSSLKLDHSDACASEQTPAMLGPNRVPDLGPLLSRRGASVVLVVRRDYVPNSTAPRLCSVVYPAKFSRVADGSGRCCVPFRGFPALDA
jgi:hypothetical protein